MIQSKQAKVDAGSYKRVINDINLAGADTNWFNELDVSKYTNMSDSVKNKLMSIQAELDKTGGTGKEAIAKITAEMEQASIQATAFGRILTKIGSTFVNGIVSMAVSAALSWLVTQLSDAVDKLIITADEAENLSQRFDDTFSSMQSELAKGASAISDIEDEYEELSKGVNVLGENVSLTEEEFERYHEITQTIANYIPELVSGYDEQGEAIIRLKDNVNDLSEAYKENQRLAAENAYTEVDEGNGRVIEGVYTKAQNDFKDYILGDHAGYNGLVDHTESMDILQQIETQKKLAQASLEELKSYKPANEYERKLLEEAGFKEVLSDEDVANVHNQLQKNLADFESILDTDAKRISQAGLTYAQARQGYFTELTTEQQKFVSAYMDSMDFDYIYKNGLYDQDTMERHVQDIMNIFKNMSSEDLNKLDIAVDISTLWDNDELTYDEYVAKIQELDAFLRELFGDNEDIIKVFKLAFDIPDEEELENEQDIFVNRLGEKKVSPNGEMYGVPPKEAEKLKAQGNEVANAWYDSLSKSEREFVNNISDEDLAKAVKFESTEEFDKWLEELQAEADTKPIEIRTNAGAAENLDAMKTAFDDLDTAYMASVKNQDSSGNATQNIASAADIQGVNDAFGGVTEITSDTELADINALSNALEAYDSILIESKGDAAAAQKAADKLATAYIDLSDVLDDLTEENKDYYIEQLKANGITNAEQVVNTRLSKQYKKTREALEDLSKSIAQNRKYLDAGVDAGSDYETAIENIQGDVQKLLTIYDDTGKENMDLTPEIDAQFIKDNLSDIEAATEGDIDALDRLRLEVARLNAAKAYVDIDLPSDVVAAQLDNLMNKVAELDAMDIEVGATVDDAAFIGSLQNMINSGQTTADAVSKAFESMGYNVEFTHKTASVELVEYVEKHGANGMPSYVPQKMKEQISVPELKITRASKASGASVSKYSGGGSSSSGGGSGGGGSNSDSDSSDETFDWIEVKINRLEEDLEDLSKTADDVYENWGKRNQAVANQIKDLTEEVQLQKDAAQGYWDKAESINLSDEYKKKVQEGKIEIETITDQTTIDNINDYTDYWNKYKDAMSKAKELSITLSEYQQTLFDNIETQYDDLITNIEKKVDRIDEQISRTEEYGFFVDRSYYDQQLKLEAEKYKNLENKRNELINKLNEGIDKGRIEVGSEAWNDMYQSILDVNQAMEESVTNTRKLNNEIRQLEWDRFDWIEERMSDFATEADFLIKILQGENNYLDDGNFNNRGFAQAALVGAKYNDTLDKMLRYKEQIAEIDKKIAEDEKKYGAVDKENIARKEELVSEYRSAIEAAEDYKQAMQSLVQEGINKHLEALNELIEKYKESLSAEKDLYDWQKNVADQTKNIAELQKQLAAYEGDTSEEARKKRQELQSQLSSAQQSLEESQWDRYISETEELLGNLYEDYEDYLNSKLENVTELMEEMVKYLNDNGLSVEQGLAEIKKEYGLTTQHFEEFGKGQNDLLNEWKSGAFVGDMAAVRTTINEMHTDYITNSQSNTEKILAAINKVGEVVSDATTGKVSVKEPKTSGSGGGTTNNNPNNPGGGDDKTKSGLTDQSTGEGKWVQNNDTSWSYFNPDGTWMHDTWFQDPDDGYWYYFDPTGRMLTNQFVGDNENEGYWLGDDGKMLPDKFTWQEDDTGWWFGDGNGNFVHDDEVWINGKQYRFNSKGYWYAKGTKGVPFNQLAYTQEDGQELVYRTDSGALLTPLGQGDMVFTNAMTQRLWEIASGTIPFSGTNLSTPNVSSNLSQNVSTENTFNFNLPNVTNADEFIDELKNNERFEKIVQEVSIGRMMGNNKLNKYKY